MRITIEICPLFSLNISLSLFLSLSTYSFSSFSYSSFSWNKIFSFFSIVKKIKIIKHLGEGNKLKMKVNPEYSLYIKPPRKTEVKTAWIIGGYRKTPNRYFRWRQGESFFDSLHTTGLDGLFCCNFYSKPDHIQPLLSSFDVTVSLNSYEMSRVFASRRYLLGKLIRSCIKIPRIEAN
jgi:hypothetical protein